MNLKAGDLFEFPTGLYRLCEERPNEILLFQREGLPLDMPLSRAEFELMHGRGEVAKIDYFTTRNLQTEQETRQQANDNAVFGPHEEHSPDAVRARTLQFYVREWDKNGTIGLGKKGLDVFIEDVKEEAQRRKLTHDVTPGTLWRVIRSCGEKGNRPLRVFRSRRGKGTRKRLGDAVHKMLDEAASFYWRERGRDFNDAQAYFRSRMDKENALRRASGDPELKYPKRMETLRRRINAGICHDNWARKYSKGEADQKFVGISDGLQADKPLELVIIDHTKVDTWTVLDSELHIPLGRPTLTIAIDVATRMILGHLLSFEPPSLFSVLTTLKRVNKNKRYIAKIFPDIPGTSDAWGHPETIVVDNGLEFVGSSFQDALADLGTEVIWAPVRNPKYKAIGERFFGTLNTMLFHKQKGGVPYDPKQMRLVGLDPSKDAVITLGDLDALVHHAIIVYQNERHEGLGAIPARIWKEKIARHGRRYIPDIKQLGPILGRVETGTLSRAGLKFKNMVFHEYLTTKRLMDELLRYEKKRKLSGKPTSPERVDVKFKWNPADASHIDVWHHGAEKPHYVPLPNRDKKFSAGLSFWHADQVWAYHKAEDEKFRTDEEKWNAREELRRHWERVAVQLPLRKSRDARRGLAQTIGTYEEADQAEETAPLTGDEVNLIDGSKVPLVPTEVPAYERTDSTEPPTGLPRTKAEVKAAAEAKREKKVEAAKENKRQTREKRRREASGAKVKPGTGQKDSYVSSFLEEMKQEWKVKDADSKGKDDPGVTGAKAKSARRLRRHRDPPRPNGQGGTTNNQPDE